MALPRERKRQPLDLTGCEVCRRPPAAEGCGHVECPWRILLTASPPSYAEGTVRRAPRLDELDGDRG